MSSTGISAKERSNKNYWRLTKYYLKRYCNTHFRNMSWIEARSLTLLGVIAVQILCLTGNFGTCTANPLCTGLQCANHEIPQCSLTTRPTTSCRAQRTQIHQCNERERALGRNTTSRVVFWYQTADDSFEKINTALDMKHTDDSESSCNQGNKTGETNSICSWDYVWDSNANRVPEYIYRAKLRTRGAKAHITDWPMASRVTVVRWSTPHMFSNSNVIPTLTSKNGYRKWNT